LAIGILLVSILFIFKKSHGGFGPWLYVFLLIIAVYGIQVGIGATAKRFEQKDDFFRRLEVSAAVSEMVVDYPLSGVGLGNFQRIYPEYELARFSGQRNYVYAHNDWMQIGAEMGIPGMLLALTGYLFFLVRSVRLWLKNNDHFVVALGAGLLIGYIALGIHSFFDFNLHIQANILFFAVYLALMHAVLALEVHKYGKREKYFKQQRSASRGWIAGGSLLLLLVGISAFLMFCCTFVLKQYRAEALCPTMKNSTLNFTMQPSLAEIKMAIQLSPSNPLYRRELANRYLELIDENEGVWTKNMLEKAAEHFSDALKLSPANAYLWLNLGESRIRLHSVRGQKLKIEDINCLKRAISLRPNDFRFLHRVAGWMLWIYKQDNIDTLDLEFREDALQCLQKGLEHNPNSWRDFVDFAWPLTKDEQLIVSCFEHVAKKMKAKVKRRISRMSS
jgi:tetratricopeptide (TPR) repeat protein